MKNGISSKKVVYGFNSMKSTDLKTHSKNSQTQNKYEVKQSGQFRIKFEFVVNIETISVM